MRKAVAVGIRTVFKGSYFTWFTLLALVGLTVLIGTLLWMERNVLIHERMASTQQVVETAHAVLEHYRALEESGQLTPEQAREQAAAAIRGVRYGDGQYLYIARDDGRMVMQPVRPRDEGHDMTGLADADGFKFIEALIQRAVQAGDDGVFVNYRWPEPGSEVPIEKMTYGKSFAPWHWVLASGVYVSTINALIWKQAWIFILAGVVLGVVLWLVGIVLSHRLVQRLGGGTEAVINMVRQIACGDLSLAIPHHHGDRNSLMHYMGEMRDGIASSVARVRSNTQGIGTSVGRIVSGNADLSSRTEQQAASLEQTASSMEQINSTVGSNAENARQATSLATDTARAAQQGGDRVSEMVETMKDISASTQQMTEIIGMIDSIAFQTNLLALNASVEAARAGEHGRGFAVVASEVRVLAGRSAESAREINALVSTVVDKIDSGVQVAENTGSSMSEVVNSVQKVADLMAEITMASNEQASGIQEINQAISQMDQVTQQNAGLVEQSGEAVKALELKMSDLNASVAEFRLRESDVPAARQAPATALAHQA